MNTQPSNFTFLAIYDPQFVRLGSLAERYFKDDPSTSLIKLRQFGELLAQLTAANAGQFTAAETPAQTIALVVANAEEAAKHLDIDEATTRALVDMRLRARGWEAGTTALLDRLDQATFAKAFGASCWRMARNLRP